MAHLRAIEGILAGEDVELSDGMTVGRAEDNDVWLDDMAVSRHHARIELTDRGVVLEDLNSGNGTFVNEQRIDQPTVLQDQDTVAFGRQLFRFVGREGQRRDAIPVLDPHEEGGRCRARSAWERGCWGWTEPSC